MLGGTKENNILPHDGFIDWQKAIKLSLWPDSMDFADIAPTAVGHPRRLAVNVLHVHSGKISFHLQLHELGITQVAENWQRLESKT